MVKTRVWVLLIGALLLVSALLSFWALGRRAPGSVANVYVDGVCVRSVDLSLVTAGYTFSVETEKGVNTVEVEPGRIRVLEADCPDGVCVAHGWLSDAAEPIVCLPHRLVIRLEKSAASGVDAVAR